MQVDQASWRNRRCSNPAATINAHTVITESAMNRPYSSRPMMSNIVRPISASAIASPHRHPRVSSRQRSTTHATAGDGIVVTVLKGAEDGGGDTVVRAYETTGTGRDVTLGLPLLARTIATRFAPSEVKTFRIPRDPRAPVVEADLLERPLPAA